MELIRKYRVFVQHSITSGSGDIEGAPLAVLEASAAALPVISTYQAGIPDVVFHGQTGLLCEEHDVEAMLKVKYVPPNRKSGFGAGNGNAGT